MTEERFRDALEASVPNVDLPRLDTDEIVARGRRRAWRRRGLVSSVLLLVLGTVGVAWTTLPTDDTRSDVVVPPPAPTVAREVSEAAAGTCARWIQQPSGTARPEGSPLTGLAEATSSRGTAVVVGDGDQMWTCLLGLEPAHPRTDAAPAAPDGVPLEEASRWNFQMASTSVPGGPGFTVWTGGKVPDAGTTDIRYHFPDGHVEAAEIFDGPNGGYFAMAYSSPNPFKNAGRQPLWVQVLGSDQDPNYRMTLQIGPDTCRTC